MAGIYASLSIWRTLVRRVQETVRSGKKEILNA